MYRIYTENRNRELILEAIARYFDGATIFEATGLWQGERESSLVIELCTNERESVLALADEIRCFNAQEAVMVTRSEVTTELVVETT